MPFRKKHRFESCRSRLGFCTRVFGCAQAGRRAPSCAALSWGLRSEPAAPPAAQRACGGQHFEHVIHVAVPERVEAPRLAGAASHKQTHAHANAPARTHVHTQTRPHAHTRTRTIGTRHCSTRPHTHPTHTRTAADAAEPAARGVGNDRRPRPAGPPPRAATRPMCKCVCVCFCLGFCVCELRV